MENLVSEKTDPNPDPKPSALRGNSTKRPMFGASGKSLSFEEQICTVIPNDPIFKEGEDKNTWKWMKNKISWWNPDGERNLAQYCMQTSIHGLKYLGEPQRHIIERIFWVIAFTLSCVVTAYLINSVWLKYTESPIVITLQPFETFVEKIPFPAVTICNMNKVMKSKATQYMRLATGPVDDPKTIEAWKNVYFLDHVCSTSNKPFSTSFNYTSTQGTVDPDILELASSKIKATDNNVEGVAEFLQKASQPCSDMLKLCMWQGEVYNCSEIFRPIETNFGKCCTFNMVPQTLLHRYRNDSRDRPEQVKDWNEWDVGKDGLIFTDSFENRKKFPRRQYRAGKVSGLSFLVDPALQEYYCTSSDSTGFRLATHLATDVPHVSDFGLAIRTNAESFVSVRPELTIADDAIRNIPQNKRNCYMDGEYELKYYNYYTSWNCLDECIANLTYEKCNCVRYYMPRDEKRKICSPFQYSCAENVKKTAYISGVKSICQNCLPQCTEIRYHSEATATSFRSRGDLWTNDFNESTSWAKSNVSVVHVYFGQDSTYARVRSQLYGFTDLIANFGGLMGKIIERLMLGHKNKILFYTGLCMGFSGLSLLELIYFFTMRVWFRNKRKASKRKKMEQRQAVERDREKALAYLGIGLTPSRRSSIDSTRSDTTAYLPRPIISNIEKDGDNINHGSNSPRIKYEGKTIDSKF